MRLIIACVAASLLAGCNVETPADRNSEVGPDRATPDVSPRTIEASFDCGRARGQAQELICADANLAAMDREVERLTALAAEPAGQADYAQRRDDCWKADELRQCVMATTMLEIHRLRKGSDPARRGEGLSEGPNNYSCKGIAGPVLATFVNSDPGAVAIEWDGEAIAIDHVPTASGTRFDGRWEGRSYAFWDKGEEATFTVSGKGDRRCVEQAN